jgi:hypothetical protein
MKYDYEIFSFEYSPKELVGPDRRIYLQSKLLVDLKKLGEDGWKAFDIAWNINGSSHICQVLALREKR